MTRPLLIENPGVKCPDFVRRVRTFTEIGLGSPSAKAAGRNSPLREPEKNFPLLSI